MNIFEVSKIGAFHTNHNEDASAIVEIGAKKIMIAAMDGCSMGTESHFAATLIAKLLRKIGKELGYREFAERRKRDAKEYLEEVLRQLFQDLGTLKNQLHLETVELLSTLILGIFDTQKKEVELITVGDGLICCNNVLYEYEQDDKPDYLGYHLAEQFENWWLNQSQKLSLKNVKDLSISSDGIFTFKNFDGKEYRKITEEEILAYLLIDEKWEHKAQMLEKKIVIIEKKYGLVPSDDLTIIRIIVG